MKGAILFATFAAAASTAVAQGALDQYGGSTQIPCPKGLATSFYTQKVGNRWWICTPAGNAFWMLGVYQIAGDSHVDESGGTYDARFQSKYGSTAIGWPQSLRRLKSWGFNTVGPYSYTMTWPSTTNSAWAGGQQPVKMPMVGIAYHPAARSVTAGACLNLYGGLDSSVVTIGRNFPDVFDPGYASFVNNANATDWALTQWRTVSANYLMGMFSDDTDDVYGFGAGTDFPTRLAGRQVRHDCGAELGLGVELHHV